MRYKIFNPQVGSFGVIIQTDIPIESPEFTNLEFMRLFYDDEINDAWSVAAKAMAKIDQMEDQEKAESMVLITKDKNDGYAGYVKTGGRGIARIGNLFDELHPLFNFDVFVKSDIFAYDKRTGSKLTNSSWSWKTFVFMQYFLKQTENTK